MITLFVIGIIVFTMKLVHLALKAAWGITKGVLFVIGIPALLIVLFVAGLVSLAIPLLILALLVAFLGPKPCEVKDSATLYKIGMFAAMNHVTVKTLRFYEEQSLLIPALINQENGYRYYTLSQMAVLHQITALKLAGFTLEEIARIHSGADDEAVLLKKKSELLAKISDLTRQISVVDGYLSKKKTGLSAPVLIKTIPGTTVAFLRTRLESYDGLFDRMPEMGALMEKAGCVCALPEYCFTNYLEPGYKDGDILVEICESVVEAKKETGDLRFKTLPEIQAACVFHKGTYGTFSESYETLLRYIEENGYEIAGAIRESYIDGVWNKDDESQWLSEIQVPVRRKTGSSLN